MPVTIAKLEQIVQTDYQQICHRAKLTPVPLDIYEIVDGSQELTKYGMPKSYPHAGYDQKVIHLPFHDLELEMFVSVRRIQVSERAGVGSDGQGGGLLARAVPGLRGQVLDRSGARPAQLWQHGQ